MAIIQGTQGNDFLLGISENDEIFGLAGDDSGGAGAGNDTVYGGKGNDDFNGGDDDDTVNGGNGNDLLDGGYGNDTVNGGNGNDDLYGDFGNDTLVGGSGNDFLLGVQRFLSATPGEIDVLTGGAGTDTFGVIYSYDDDDPLAAGTTDYALIKDFNPSQDFIQLTGAKTNYFLAASPDGLPKGTAIFLDKPGIAPDELIAIVEKKSGLNLNDSYFTTFVKDSFYGTDEPDQNDSFYGTNGANQFDGGEGDDALFGNNGDDSLTGGNKNDSLLGGQGNDSLDGGDGDDSLRGANNILVGENGTGEIDTFTGGAGKDNFILGEAQQVSRFSSLGTRYYDDHDTTTAGTTDYALIKDFDSSQDVIQLLETAVDYNLGSSSGVPTGTGIYFNNSESGPNELIAILEGVSPSSLSLTESYFSYVPGTFSAF